MEEQATPTPENVADLNQNSAALHGVKVETVDSNENGALSNGVHVENNRILLPELDKQKQIPVSIADMTTSTSQDTGFGSASVSEVSSPVESSGGVGKLENPTAESETEAETYDSVVLDDETENDQNTLNSEASYENVVQAAHTEDINNDLGTANEGNEKTGELEFENTSSGNQVNGSGEEEIVEKASDKAEDERHEHASDIVVDVKNVTEDHFTETKQKLVDSVNVGSTDRTVSENENVDNAAIDKGVDRNVVDATTTNLEEQNKEISNVTSFENVKQHKVNYKNTDDVVEVVNENVKDSTSDVLEKSDYISLKEPEVKRVANNDTENESSEKVICDVKDNIEAEKLDGHEAKTDDTKVEREQHIVAGRLGEVEQSAAGEDQKVDDVSGNKAEDEIVAERLDEFEKVVERLDEFEKVVERLDEFEKVAERLDEFEKVAERLDEFENAAGGADQKVNDVPVDKAEDEKEADDEEKGTMDILGNGFLKKKVLVPGQGVHTRPNNGDIVTIKVDGLLPDGTHVDTGELTFNLNDGDVILAFDLAVALMEEGEKCELFTSEKYAYGSLGREPDIPKDASITYTLELVKVEPSPAITEMNYDQRLKLGEAKRERGNYLFGRTDYSGAINSYSRAVKLLDNPELNEGIDENCRSILTESWVKCYNNLAACQLKIDAVDSAIKSCEKVLSVQKDNVKALFRLGKAYGIKGEVDVAISYLRDAIRLEPEAKIMQQEMLNLTRRKSKETATEKELYQRMFGVRPGEKSLADENKRGNSNKLAKWTLVVGGLAAVLISVGLTWYRAS